jgi:transcriptional repressor NrdR
MRCPFCGELDKDRVLDSRPVRESSAIRRRRECDACQGRFTTFEEIEELRLMVRKADGSLQPFDAGKLRRAIETACRKRPISEARILTLVEEIERVLLARQEREVDSADLGALAMERLRLLDQVAYVRFASVYHRFEGAHEFSRFVDRL